MLCTTTVLEICESQHFDRHCLWSSHWYERMWHITELQLTKNQEVLKKCFYWPPNSYRRDPVQSANMHFCLLQFITGTIRTNISVHCNDCEQHPYHSFFIHKIPTNLSYWFRTYKQSRIERLKVKKDWKTAWSARYTSDCNQPSDSDTKLLAQKEAEHCWTSRFYIKEESASNCVTFKTQGPCHTDINQSYSSVKKMLADYQSTTAAAQQMILYC